MRVRSFVVEVVVEVVVAVVVVVVVVVEWVPRRQMTKMSWKRRNWKKRRKIGGWPLLVVNVQPLVQHQLIEDQAWFFELRVVQTVVLLWVHHQVVVRPPACVGHFFVQQEMERRPSQHIENRAYCSG